MVAKVAWERPAKKAAEFISSAMMPAHRGCIDLEWCAGVLIAFGNDGYADDLRSQRSVESIRRYLTSTEHGEEVAFATSDDGYTWAMIVVPGEEVFCLAGMLNEIAWNGWTFHCNEQEVRSFRALQTAIAVGVVEEHGPSVAACLAGA